MQCHAAALLLLCTLSQSVLAGPLGFNVYGVSKHFDTDNELTREYIASHGQKELNERNYGLGINYSLAETPYSHTVIEAGAYRDSLNETAVLVGVMKQWCSGFLCGGLSAGVVRSESYIKGLPMLYFMPTISTALNNRVRIVYGYLPSMDVGQVHTIPTLVTYLTIK